MKTSFYRYIGITLCTTLLLASSGCIAVKELDQGSTELGPDTTREKTVRDKQRGEIQKRQQGADAMYSLAEVTDSFCNTLIGEIGPQKIFFDRTKILDLATKDVSNFSGYLEQEIDSSCSLMGFNLVYDISEADYVVGALYRRYKDDLRIFFKYHQVGGVSKKSLDFRIAKDVLPPDSFNSMEYKARMLAKEIAQGQNGKKIYIKPVVNGNNRAVSEFSKAFAARVKKEIVREYKKIAVIDWKQTRSIAVMQKTAKQANSDVAATGADAAISGEYFIEGDIVAVHLTLTSQTDNRLLNAATVDIAKEDIQAKLEDTTNEILATVADFKEENSQETITLSTTRGSEYPMYSNGEIIQFTINTRKPLYVYLYNFDPAGKVTLLFPYNRKQVRLRDNAIHTIPSDADTWLIKVTPPYGRELLKVFAASKPIPYPDISIKSTKPVSRGLAIQRQKKQQQLASSGRVLHPNDLVDYYRGMGRTRGIEIYEDSFILETNR